MPRLIDPETFDGAQRVDEGLRVWSKAAGGRRASELFDGDEAEEAAVEIRDLLGGMSDLGEAPGGAKKKRKAG